MEHVLAPVEGTPSINSEMHDFDDVASALLSEQTLCPNPAVSNVHAVIYLLFYIFRRLPGVTRLSPTQPQYDRSPYDLASSADAYARGSKGGQHCPLSHPNSWEWRAMLPPVSSTSWMTTLRVMAPASAMWCLATVCPRSAL